MMLKILVLVWALTGLACSEAEFSDAPSSLAYQEKTVVINEGAEWTTDSQVMLQLQGGYAREMFISSDAECQTGQWEKYRRTKPWKLTQHNEDAQVYVKYRTQHKSKGIESECVSDSIRHDAIAPVVEFRNPKNVINNQSQNDVKFLVTDNFSGIEKVECSLDGQAYVICDRLFQATDLDEGEHILQVIAHDKAGNESQPVLYTWSVDRSAPQVELIQKPNLFTKSSAAEFRFRVQDAMAGVQVVECRVGNRSFQSCGLSKQKFMSLAAGEQQFEVRAIDKAGNISEPVSYKWVIDQTPPVLRWLKRPPAYLKPSEVSEFQVEAKDTSSGLDKILCARGGKDFKTCSEVFSFEDLPAGEQKVIVQAVDKVGNASQPQSYTWYLDGTPPRVQFIAEKSTPLATNKNTALVYFQAEDAGSGVKQMMCSSDNLQFNTCRSPMRYKNLSNGKHLVFVKAEDKVGNMSAAVSYAWRVDTDKPQVLITSHPSPLTQQKGATFQFEGTDSTGRVVDYLCYLGQGDKTISSQRSCKKGEQQYQDLLAGKYEFRVQARDDVGNLSAPARFEWFVDHTAPDLEWLSRPAHYISDVQRSDFIVLATDEHTGVKQILCGLSPTELKDCSENFSFGFLPEGLHNVYVKVVDNVGNTSPEHSYAWRVDSTPPRVSVDTERSAAAFSNNVLSEVYFDAVDTASGVDKILCSIRGSEFTPCTSPTSYSTAQSGEYSMKVKAVDKVGNESQPTEYHWTVDRSLPVVSLTQQPDLITQQTQALFAFKAQDQEGPVGSYECRVLKDSKLVLSTQCESPYTKHHLEENVYQFEVVAFDKAGNKSLPARYEWKIDLSPPSMGWLLKPAAFTGPREVAKFAVRATDTLSGVGDVKCGLSPSQLTSCGKTFSFDNLAPGPAEVYVQAVDKVGNASAIYKYKWFIDGTPPVVSFDHDKISQPSLDDPTAIIYFQATDEASGVQQFLCSQHQEDRSFKACRSPLKLSRLGSGHYAVYVKAVDKVGNISKPVVYSWDFDARAPRVEITSHPAMTTRDIEAQFAFKGIDDSGKIEQYTCSLYKKGRLVRSASICTPPYKYENLDQGMYQFVVQAEDPSGNRSKPVSFDWRIDRTGPIVQVEGPRASFKHETTELTIKVDNIKDVDMSTVRCYLNDEPLSYCRLDQPVRITNEVHGLQKFVVELQDHVGNIGTNHFEWNVNRKFSNKTNDVDVDGINSVDILFVLDNSTSMASEHRNLAEKINGFLEIVDGLNYHIALTTTDMENKRQDGSNGSLRGFLNDEYHIDTNMPLYSAQDFLSTAFRKVGTGGSLKEEGISAVMGLLRRALSDSTQVKDLRARAFLRDDAHFAVVVISDSDQPSRGLRGSELLNFIRGTWPHKRFVWNSIIAIEGDKKCGGEKKGVQYASLSEATGGIIGSVCAESYASQLEDIGERVLALVTQITLECEPADVDQDGTLLKISRIDPKDPSQLIPYTGGYKVVDRQVSFDQFLDMGRYKLTYQCYDN